MLLKSSTLKDGKLIAIVLKFRSPLIDLISFRVDLILDNEAQLEILNSLNSKDIILLGMGETAASCHVGCGPTRRIRRLIGDTWKDQRQFSNHSRNRKQANDRLLTQIM